jgi:hypothetical protein
MQLIFRFLGLILDVSFGQEATVVEVEAYRLGTSDNSFGFAPDPLVEPYWTDDTDDY